MPSSTTTTASQERHHSRKQSSQDRYPSGDKRLTFIQLEGLTGLSARDEWDFKFFGMTNQPFIEANYPHHEDIWGWEDVGDQVVLVVSNIKKVMVEYHDILWISNRSCDYCCLLPSCSALMLHAAATCSFSDDQIQFTQHDIC